MPQKPKSKFIELQIPEGIEQVLIYRERKPSKAELKDELNVEKGDIIAENILITFDGGKKPEVSVNAEPCTPDDVD